jgi:hypothetical protein
LGLLLLVLLCVSPGAWGFPVTFGGMACDLPEGWAVLSSSDKAFAATNNGMADGTGVFQANWLPPTAYAGAREMLAAVEGRLGATGEVSTYLFDGRPVALADVRFSAGGNAARGYLLCIDGVQADVAVLAYADEADYDAQIDYLISALDSFRLAAGGAPAPGPLSQLLAPFPARAAMGTVDFNGKAVPVPSDPTELDAVQSVVEREARLLVAYTDRPDRDEAWRRSYRLIYRASYPRLVETARAIGEAAGGSRSTPAERAAKVLAWVQAFSFTRTGTLSDLLSPLASLATRSGDCDARALAYVIVMSYLGVPGVLLVSSVYSHAVAAVAVDSAGLGLALDGKRYLVAETTTAAPLGWIAEEQRDLAKWVIVRFDQ